MVGLFKVGSICRVFFIFFYLYKWWKKDHGTVKIFCHVIVSLEFCFFVWLCIAAAFFSFVQENVQISVMLFFIFQCQALDYVERNSLNSRVNERVKFIKAVDTALCVKMSMA